MGNDYKFTPIIVEKNKEGNIELTEDKLKELLSEAYKNGFVDGQISSIKDNPNIYPQPQSIPLPLVPDTPKMPEFYWDKFYCLSNTDILKGGAHETDF